MFVVEPIQILFLDLSRNLFCIRQLVY